MVVGPISGLFAGGSGLLDDWKKVAPMGVSEKHLQISGKPAFYPVDFRRIGFEVSGKRLYEFFVHAPVSLKFQK